MIVAGPMSALATPRASGDSERLRVGFVLVAIIAASTAVQAILALRLTAPQGIPDELIYSEIAKSLSEGRAPGIRGHAAFTYGPGYPLLLSPLWALFDDVAAAYTAARLLNALLISATAIPVYLLARSFVDTKRALVVAGLSVSIPSMLYAGLLLTEVALYPAFALAVALMTRSLMRPSSARQIAALGAIALACSIKALAFTLLIAYPICVGLFHWLDARQLSEWRSRMRLYAPLWFVLAGLGVSAIALSLAVGLGRPLDLLGAYADVAENIDPLTTPWWLLLHLAEIDLYLAVTPFAAAVLVAARGFRSSSSPDERLFAAVATPLTLCLLLVIAMVASRPQAVAQGYALNDARLSERNAFLVVPLFLLALVLWLRDRRGGVRLVLATLGVSAALPGLIPIAHYDSNVRVQALALVPWVTVNEDLIWPAAVLAFTVSLALLFVLAWRARLRDLAFYAPVAAVFAVVIVVAHMSLVLASDWSRAGAAGETANWVDLAVGDEDVAVLWANHEPRGEAGLLAHHLPLFVGEFFNRRLGKVYEIGGPLPYALPSTKVRLEGGRVVGSDGSRIDLGRYVLTPCHVDISGITVARDPVTGARVVRVGDASAVNVQEPESC